MFKWIAKVIKPLKATKTVSSVPVVKGALTYHRQRVFNANNDLAIKCIYNVYYMSNGEAIGYIRDNNRIITVVKQPGRVYWSVV